MTTEVAPAASGRLSVANPLSGRGPCLIHHPSAVDCPTSLTTGLQGTGLQAQLVRTCTFPCTSQGPKRGRFGLLQNASFAASSPKPTGLCHLKTGVKWLWSAKPALAAISARAVTAEKNGGEP